MKPITGVPGYPANKWMIDLEYSPWLPRPYVYRSEGRNGQTVLFDSQAEAEAKIAELQAEGLQGIIDHHQPKPRRKPKITAEDKPGA